MLRKGVVKKTETGEIILCVETDDNVPFGCELGGPRPRTIREEWPLILALLAMPAFIIFIIIVGIIKIVSGH